MSKGGYLLKNTGILAIGNFSSKLLVFLLVPLYTAVLSTSEYGAYDIIYSSVSLLVPVLTLNISDAMLRFPLEEGADVPRIAKLGIGLTLASGLVVFMLQLAESTPWAQTPGVQYLAAFYIVTALYQLLLLLARGCEHMIDVALAGVISSVVMLVLNIALLLGLGWGLDGFFIANITGMAAAAIFLLIRMRDVIFAPSQTKSIGLLSTMVQYSVPLAATVIGWWFINSSGRYIVTAICGFDANGLYSIAFRIPAILTSLAGIFIQAWQVSVIKELDPSDSDGFLRRAFDATEMVLVLLCSVLIATAPLTSMVLFSGDFYDAWEYVPFLLVFAVFNTMSGLWGPFYSALYDTKPLALSALMGSVVNVVLGLLLALMFGVWGVVIANVFAGFANWLCRGAWLSSRLQFGFHMGQSCLKYMILVLQGVVLVVLPISLMLRVALALLGTAGFLLLYRSKLKEGGSILRKMWRERQL